MILYQHIRAFDEEYLEGEVLENIQEEQDSNPVVAIIEEQISAIEERTKIEETSAKRKLTRVCKEKSAEKKSERKTLQQWLCNVCSKTFRTKSALQSHVKEHKSSSETDQWKEKKKSRKMCQLCGLSFATNGWYHHVGLILL